MPLAQVIMSGVTPKVSAANGVAEAAEAGDDLVEDQQDAVLVADLAQALQVALRRGSTPVEPATGSTMTAAMVDASCSADDALQLVGELGAMLRLARVKAFLPGRGCAAGGRRRPAACRTSCGWPTMPPTEMPPKLTPW
jgi:3-oxoacyl-ACP reductase-like protein